MSVIGCRHFTGYKPCPKNTTCNQQCAHRDIPTTSILIVHLGALGAVVRSTANLRAIKRKYPGSMITWVTDAPAHHLLKNHPAIDRVLTTNENDMLQLSALEFEIAFVVDKSLKAVGVIKRTTVDHIYGFKSHPVNGAIIPATAAAEELWSLGLDNNKKFFENKKPETQLMIEALELGEFRRDEYWLPLTAEEEKKSQECKAKWLGSYQGIIGLNTGCSSVIAYKKLSVEMHRELILKLRKEMPHMQIVLLGGPEDTERNQRISYGLDVINSDTESGLRDGLVSVAACDVVVTGDSLGMHMAISQSKQVVAWFGPTCEQEIDLYDRGFKILSQSPCSPCWKRTCEKSIMCYDQVSLKELMDAIKSCCTNGLSGGLAPLDTAPQKNERAVATT